MYFKYKLLTKLSLFSLFFLTSACSCLSIQKADILLIEEKLYRQERNNEKLLELSLIKLELLEEISSEIRDGNKSFSYAENEVFKGNFKELLENQEDNKKTLEEISRVLNVKTLYSEDPSLKKSDKENKDAGLKRIIGEVECVFINPPGLSFDARMDTGAETSSIDARKIEYFERDGKDWVRFELINPKNSGFIKIEKKLLRKARILQSSHEEGERRPVIELSVSIGENTQLAEFTLSDRSHMSFPVLIGRNVLKDLMIVDVSLKNTIPVKRKKSSEAVKQVKTEDKK